MKSQDYRPAYGSPIFLKVKKNKTHIAVLKTDGLPDIIEAMVRFLGHSKNGRQVTALMHPPPHIKADKITSTG